MKSILPILLICLAVPACHPGPDTFLTPDIHSSTSFFETTLQLRALGQAAGGIPDGAMVPYLDLNDLRCAAFNNDRQVPAHPASRVSPIYLQALPALYFSGNGYGTRSNRCNYPTLYTDYQLSYFVLKPWLSPPMQQYMLQYAAEAAAPVHHCEALTLAPEALVRRIIRLEKLLNDYPDFLFREACKNLKKTYTNVLLTGVQGNGVLAGPGLQTLSPYFEKAYTYLLGQYPRSETAALVAPWYKVLRGLKPQRRISQLWQDYFKRGFIVFPPACCGVC